VTVLRQISGFTCDRHTANASTLSAPALQLEDHLRGYGDQVAVLGRGRANGERRGKLGPLKQAVFGGNSQRLWDMHLAY